jgi:hypothetical protein
MLSSEEGISKILLGNKLIIRNIIAFEFCRYIAR